MQRRGHLFVGCGFLWISAWSLFGSLLGARAHLFVSSGESTGLGSWQHTLLKSAHAHMNLMGVTLVLIGIGLWHTKHLPRFLSPTLWAHLWSVVFFGLGLILESLTPPHPFHTSLGALTTAAAAFVYILTMGVLGCFFLFFKSI
jgi:hypothetical protein